MATQVQTLTDTAQQQVSGAQEKATGTVSGAGEKVQGYTSNILSSLDGILGGIKAWAMSLLNRFFPPEQRNAFLEKVQNFVSSNPKLSAFLGMNIFITGVPLALFILFTIFVLVFSLLIGLVLGLLGAIIFTVFMVGVALTIVLPFIFFTTAGACFLFLWALGGYYILKWANERGDTMEENGMLKSSVGDTLNNLTGGRLTGFLGELKNRTDISGFSDENMKPEAPKKDANGAAKKPEKSEKQTVGIGNVSSTPQQALILKPLTQQLPHKPSAPIQQAPQQAVPSQPASKTASTLSSKIFTDPSYLVRRW